MATNQYRYYTISIRDDVLLVGCRVVGREVFLQRGSSSAVKEVLRDGRVCDKIELSPVVGRDVAAIEIR